MANNMLTVLKEKIKPYVTLPYSTLIDKTKESEPMYFQSGAEQGEAFYEGEIIFAFDDRKSGNIRIIGEIQDGMGRNYNYNVIIDHYGNIISEG
jgi:hypothetical protein